MRGEPARVKRLVANADVPADIPVKPQGSIAVIVRVMSSDGAEEWRPTRAVRWTATHGMAASLDDDSNPRSGRYEWLRAGDVMRSATWFVPPVAGTAAQVRHAKSDVAPPL